MKEKAIIDMGHRICEHILTKEVMKHNMTMQETMTVLSFVVYNLITAICITGGYHRHDMATAFCKAIMDIFEDDENVRPDA